MLELEINPQQRVPFGLHPVRQVQQSLGGGIPKSADARLEIRPIIATI
jgi:hypothetical protein